MAKCEHDRFRAQCSVCKPELVFKMYERRAAQRNLIFQISLDDFLNIVQQPCVFCGEENSPRGVDRRDSRVGYILTNCQSCCQPCNSMKSDSIEYLFLNQVKKIAAYQERLQQQKLRMHRAEVL